MAIGIIGGCSCCGVCPGFDSFSPEPVENPEKFKYITTEYSSNHHSTAYFNWQWNYFTGGVDRKRFHYTTRGGGGGVYWDGSNAQHESKQSLHYKITQYVHRVTPPDGTAPYCQCSTVRAEGNWEEESESLEGQLGCSQVEYTSAVNYIGPLPPYGEEGTLYILLSSGEKYMYFGKEPNWETEMGGDYLGYWVKIPQESLDGCWNSFGRTGFKSQVQDAVWTTWEDDEGQSFLDERTSDARWVNSECTREPNQCPNFIWCNELPGRPTGPWGPQWGTVAPEWTYGDPDSSGNGYKYRERTGDNNLIVKQTVHDTLKEVWGEQQLEMRP